jgi:steroid delta-isomerase-like uncharacterized protein
MGRFEELTKEFNDAINRHDADAAAATYAEDCVAHDPMYPDPLKGRSAIREDIATFFRAFPDMRFEVVNLLEKGDVGTAEMRFSGTNTGPLTTPTGDEVPPTGKRIDLLGAVYVKLGADGLVKEEHRYYDTAAFTRMLGLTPEAAEVGTR